MYHRSMPYRPIRPRAAAKRRSKLPLFFVGFVFVLYLLLGVFIVPSGVYAGTVTFRGTNSPGTQPDIRWPSYGQAAIGTLEGGVLASHGSQSSAPTASMAKVMTALSILREKPLSLDQQGPTITLSQNDVDLYNQYIAKNGSVALVAAGEEISEYQALQAMMLPSANNMADSMAIWAFGSMKDYVAYANNYARELGMSASYFADASGFSPATVSTATDLIILGQAALNNPVLAEIVAQPSAVIPVAGTIRNVNTLLGSGNNFVGIKTGNTDQAGYCLLWAATHQIDGQTITIIGVIMGAPKRITVSNDTIALLKSVRPQFTVRHIADDNTAVGHYTLPWGEHVSVVTKQPIDVLAWRGADITPRLALNSVSAPAKDGQVVGKIIIEGTAVNQEAESTPLVLAQDIKPPSLWWRLTHPVDSWRLRFGHM